MQTNSQKIINLVEILEDQNSRLDEKDDALIDLGNIDSYDVLKFLVQFGSDKNNHSILLASSGESISQILSRNKSFEINLSDLTPEARSEIFSKDPPLT